MNVETVDKPPAMPIKKKAAIESTESAAFKS
jgi:hypothetical protein